MSSELAALRTAETHYERAVELYDEILHFGRARSNPAGLSQRASIDWAPDLRDREVVDMSRLPQPRSPWAPRKDRR